MTHEKHIVFMVLITEIKLKIFGLLYNAVCSISSFALEQGMLITTYHILLSTLYLGTSLLLLNF